ncbi:MAG TPA: hypothetical protein VN372_05315 [Methanospirillum sp.]|nr:hypothetical protein [Methanospirillum sp.]
MFWEPTMDILRARHAVDQGGRVYAKLTRPDGAGKTHLRPEGVVSE